MPGLGLRYDKNGRPVGLAWPEFTLSEKELKDLLYKSKRNRPKQDRTGIGGRPREDLCPAGLHLMSETGRERKDGGRECRKCVNARVRRVNATPEGKAKKREVQRRYREKKRAREQNTPVDL